MSWLPWVKKESREVVLAKEAHAIQVAQTQALTTLAKATSELSAFLTGGGLTKLLHEHSKSSVVPAILGGLAHHAGRDALDARKMGQNALEIAEVIQRTFDKIQEKQEALARGEAQDPELHSAEADFEQWLGKKR